MGLSVSAEEDFGELLVNGSDGQPLARELLEGAFDEHFRLGIRGAEKNVSEPIV
jgi:hypothetical protein